MSIYLVRHGETKINRLGGRFQGQINTPEAALNEAGKEQAIEAGKEFAAKKIRFDKVYSSPQGRAMETAMLISGKKETELVTDDRLKEMNFGPHEGQLWETMDPRKFHALMHDFMNYVPGRADMESPMALLARTSSFLEDLRKEQLRLDALRNRKEFSSKHSYGVETRIQTRPFEDPTILVSTHGGTIRAMLANLHRLDVKRFWEIPVGNCAWFKLDLVDGRLTVTDSDMKAERDLTAPEN